eukprot:6490746-Amphidinium_carterae.2
MYGSENGQGTITNPVKIATSINNLKGPIQQHLMLRINSTTTFTAVHQWISTFFNSTYSDTNEEHRTIGALIDNETSRQRTTTASRRSYMRSPSTNGTQAKETKATKEKAKTKEARKETITTIQKELENTEDNVQWCATHVVDQDTHQYNVTRTQNAKATKDNHTTTTTTAKDNSNSTTSIHNNKPTKAKELANNTTTTTTTREQARKLEFTISKRQPTTATTTTMTTIRVGGQRLTTHNSNNQLRNNLHNHNNFLALLHNHNNQQWVFQRILGNTH